MRPKVSPTGHWAGPGNRATRAFTNAASMSITRLGATPLRCFDFSRSGPAPATRVDRNLNAFNNFARHLKEVRVPASGGQQRRNPYRGLLLVEPRGQPDEIIPRHGLDEHFEGKTFAFGPYDPGIAIDTEIGRLYGVRKAYSAKWLIHVHYDDPREIHYHHVNGRLLKSFTMSYARMETRSIFHTNFPTRSANIVPRAIYESPYIRERWAFAAVLSTSPTGVMGVDADRDLIALDRRIGALILRRYGKMVQLFGTVDECFAVADDTRWLPYQHAGGLTACSLYESGTDHLDLDLPSAPPDHAGKRSSMGPVKAVVMNYAWKLFSAADLTIAADDRVAKDVLRIHADRDVVVAPNLTEAVRIAAEMTGTDKGIVFDGCYGAINMTRPMAEFLLAKAPEVARLVDRELLPKWLRQRNLPAAA
jgi:hypothetical protein